MISNKKALQSHIIVIFITSLIMTALLIAVFNSFFTNDPPGCQHIDFTIQNKCQDGNSISFEVVNNANKILKFKLNDVIMNEFRLNSETRTKTIHFPNREKTVEILPYITNAIGEETGVCKGKSVKINTGVLMKC